MKSFCWSLFLSLYSKRLSTEDGFMPIEKLMLILIILIQHCVFILSLSRALIDRVAETVKQETKKQEGRFF